MHPLTKRPKLIGLSSYVDINVNAVAVATSSSFFLDAAGENFSRPIVIANAEDEDVVTADEQLVYNDNDPYL